MSGYKKYRYLKIAAAIYLILYMLLNASFVHTHFIDGENITHSHPLTSKSHTSNEASLIKIFNNTSSVNTQGVIIPVCQEVNNTPIKSIYLNFYSYVSCNLQSLRAPPVI